MKYNNPAIKPEAGMVMIQVITMFLTNPHLTAESLWDEPDPIMAVEMTWVVLMGVPKSDMPAMTTAAEVSAENPCTGCNLNTLLPMVLITFHPPMLVPNPMAVAHAIMTQRGTLKVASAP